MVAEREPDLRREKDKRTGGYSDAGTIILFLVTTQN